MKYRNKSLRERLLRCIQQYLIGVVVVLLCPTTIAPAQTAEQIAEKALAATVYLEMQDKNGRILGIGSGFFVKPNLIATNFHIIEGATKGTAKLVDKSTKYIIKGVTATDRTNDLAILQVAASSIKPLPLGDSDAVRISETVYIAGNPNGSEGTFSNGFIKSFHGDAKKRIQVTTPISPGSSGGPVLNNSGEVIGVSVAGYLDEALDTGTLNFVIPSNYVNILLSHYGTAKPLGQNNVFISADTYFRWGYVKVTLGNYKSAISDFTDAIRLESNNIYAYFNRGQAKYYLRQHAAAIADWDMAIRLKTDFVYAYINRGFAKFELGQHTSAIVDFDTAIRLKTDFAPAYYYRGLTQDGLGQYTAAIADFDTAIRLKPDYAEAYNDRGAAKSELGQYTAAIADFDTAIWLEPNYIEAYYNRGLAAGKLGQHTTAISDFDVVIRLNPNNVYAHFNRGFAKGMN